MGEEPARETMVRTQVAARGIRDPAVLAAFRSVPREAFLHRNCTNSPTRIRQHARYDAISVTALLPLREAREDLRLELEPPRLERAIGVVYRPDTEIQSHYFHASLPHQFDEYVWFDETRAVRPVTAEDRPAVPSAHPLSPG